MYYSDTTLKNGDTISVALASSAACIVSPVYSNNIILNVTPKVTPAFAQTSGIAQEESRGIHAATVAASVYPNPSNGYFKLSAQLSNSTTQAAKVQIINAEGKVVAIYNTTAINGAINLQVNESSLSNGLYLVKYTAGNESGSNKLMISK